MTAASAAGKVILLGEHAVVYGRPAIAVPVSDLRATVEVLEHPEGRGLTIEAQDLGQSYRLDREYDDEAALPLQSTVRNTLNRLGVPVETQALRLAIHSRIPIARGMGSGTAVATALVRALAEHFGHNLTARQVSDLVYQTEILLHGTPSGIDNTVVAFEKPVYFVKDRRADPFWVGRPFTLLIADTGIPSKTRDSVAEVRQRRAVDHRRYEAIFDEIGVAVEEAKGTIARGDLPRLGRLMSRSQRLLQELGVSSPELDQLVEAALEAGALGAKLSGGGKGGCIIALVNDEIGGDDIVSALLLAEASQVMSTTVR